MQMQILLLNKRDLEQRRLSGKRALILQCDKMIPLFSWHINVESFVAGMKFVCTCWMAANTKVLVLFFGVSLRYWYISLVREIVLFHAMYTYITCIRA
mmetsp:Transcript_27414/g.40310  ORF Transcript_27414/g.40310 Transcript_27414/m.40310 type:complete len:98 (+) Transcript_27414:4841-5134(+)